MWAAIIRKQIEYGMKGFCLVARIFSVHGRLLENTIVCEKQVSRSGPRDIEDAGFRPLPLPPHGTQTGQKTQESRKDLYVF
jgi:hypothetical protein